MHGWVLKALVGAMLCVVAVGCAGPRMIVPGDVRSASDAIEATDRSRASGLLADESFILGGYRVEDVDRDANSTRSFSAGVYDRANTSTSYTYQFHSESGELAGLCASDTKRKTVDLGGGSAIDWSNLSLTCECTGEGTSAAVHVRANSNSSQGGDLKLDGTSYTVTPVTEQDGASFYGGPAGFRVDSPEGPLGAVEVLYPGKVWIAKGTAPEQAAPMACVFTGLMLYVPPRQD